MLLRFSCLGLLLLTYAAAPLPAAPIDLTHATVVIRGGELPAAEKMAPIILTEEIAKRTGANWTVTDQWPTGAQAIIAISTQVAPPGWKDQLPESLTVPKKAESFSIRVVAAQAGQPAKVFVSGRDPRGAMFGVGKLLRVLRWGTGPITVSSDLSIDTAPDREIRGHQIGYRPTANSWDAWTVEQYDQYFRDMAIFGANCVENIPTHQEDEPKEVSPMKYKRAFMNAKFAELCAKYDLDHWDWVPVENLASVEHPDYGAKFLKHLEDYFQSCKRLDAIFIPGGDPGSNPANLLLPYAADMAKVLRKHHPKAVIWISLQHFRRNDVDYFYTYLKDKKPTWFGGVVMGPGSPPLEATRQRLSKEIKIRWYPDITHIVRCQFPVPWLDPVLGLTIGREPVNPRPVDYTAIYRAEYRFTDGFLSYSDGIHDDFNKNLWTQLAWDPDRDPRDIGIEYSRFFFRGDLGQAGADALFALENNLHGSLKDNGSVDGTLMQWQQMEEKLKGVQANWRFQMYLFRSYYDAYQRHRKIYEDELENRALAKLGEANKIGVVPAVDGARQILNLATTNLHKKSWYDRIVAMAESLYQRVGLQTSVPKYHANGYERGCVMDFVNYPLNDRWWLEDQFVEIVKMSDRAAQLKQIDVVRNWENPGEGGYYEVLGDVGCSPHIPKLVYCADVNTQRRDLAFDREAGVPPNIMPTPGQYWVGNPNRIGRRFGSNVYISSVPAGLTYTGLDPHAKYTVKLFSQRSSPLHIDGKPAKLLHKGKTYDKVTEQEFEVPQETLQDGKIVLTWVRLAGERRLNWRQQHYVTELWVLRHPAGPSQPLATRQQAAKR